MSNDSGEKTEEPTQQRRDDFRKRGQVVQSKELSSVFLLFISILALWIFGRSFLVDLVDIFTQIFTTELVSVARDGDWASVFKFATIKMAIIIAPVLILFFVIAFLSIFIQIGFVQNEEALQPKIEKINPVEGLKRIFSLRSLVEGFKAIAKVSAVMGVLMLVVKSEIMTVPLLVTFSVEQLMAFTGEVVVKLFAGVGLLMTLVSILDYFFQKFDLEKKMKMTKQEVKEELKSREGDPLIKARIKRIQREMSQRRMMSDVPTADVIITNPTHISVAIKYDATMIAPKVIAIGADTTAMKIRDIAKENKIPIVENKPLARVIFKTMEIGQQIPKELYNAMAEVLSYIFKLKKKVMV